MNNKVTINVTQECIDKGIKGSPSSCPIAIASNRVLAEPVSIGIYHMWIDNSSTRLPSSAFKFRKDFDASKDVSPFSFDIDLPTSLSN